MLNELDTRWAGRGEVRYEKQMTSTNAVAKVMAQNGAPHGSLAVCDDQTAGRGRMTRAWQTPPGQALTQSLVLRLKLPPEQASLVTLAAAVAGAQAIEEVCPQVKVGIKWPNDGVIGQRKCMGILCEALFGAGDELRLILGVGINVNQTAFPADLADKATSLRLSGGQEVSRWALLTAYLHRIEDVVDALEREGWYGIREAYICRCVTLNHPVQVLSPNERYVATAYDIDQTGALLVLDEQGAQRRVLCGDVSVRGLMGYV